MKPRLNRLLLILGFIALCLTAKNSAASAQACEGLFKTVHVEEFLRLKSDSLPNEVRNSAARAHLIRLLARKLATGSYNVEVDGQIEGLSVSVDDNLPRFQIRSTFGHLSTSEMTPLTQSKSGESKGSRAGLAVQFQWLDGEKLVVTNTIISGDETTYLGLTKREIRAEFDLSGGPVKTILVQETVSTTSDYRKDDTTYTISQTIKVISRR